MNPFTEGSWLWRAWRGHSVTFAALFALAMLGVSAVGWFRHELRELGAPWWLALILPAVLIAVIARKEKDWMPDADRRSKWARWLAAGAIAFVMISTKLAPDKPAPSAPERGEPQGRAGVRHP